jgi:hypothetical protein
MRENCTYGSEGGEVRKDLPYPYHAPSWLLLEVLSLQEPETYESSPGGWFNSL